MSYPFIFLELMRRDMDSKDIRELIDKMEPKEIREIMQERNNLITKKSKMKNNHFYWKLFLIPIFLSLIFLAFYIRTSNPIGSQLLIVVFVVSLILMIIDILLMLQKKSYKFRNQPTF